MTVISEASWCKGTLLGVYRWLILSLISYILAHWAYLSTTFADRAQRAFASTNLPNWGQAAEIAFQTIFPTHIPHFKK